MNTTFLGHFCIFHDFTHTTLMGRALSAYSLGAREDLCAMEASHHKLRIYDVYIHVYNYIISI